MATIPKNKRIAIIGGGTNTYISNHLALSAPAYGTTAKILEDKFIEHSENRMSVDLYLTQMADQGATRKNLQNSIDSRKKVILHEGRSEKYIEIVSKSIKELEQNLERLPVLDTPEDVEALVDKLIADPDTRVIIFNVAMVDYKPEYLMKPIDQSSSEIISSKFGKYEGRLSTSQYPDITLELTVQDKIINKIRKERKDILLVGFKTTCGATKEEQFQKGLKLCKDASANIVFVNDVDERRITSLKLSLQSINLIEEELAKSNIIERIQNDFLTISRLTSQLEVFKKNVSNIQNNGLVTPEESSYWYNTRDEALDGLVQMVLDRSHLHFTCSTVVDSETVSWNIPTLKRGPKDYQRITECTDISKGEVIQMPNSIIPETFRTVFDWVRTQGAYKKGPTGSTVGHFGIKLGPNEFLTTKRKTDFNKMEEVGLVKVITDDPDNLFGYKHFFKPDFGDDLECYLEFIDNVLTNFTTQDFREDWLGVHGEYWDFLKIFPDLDFLTHEGYRQAKILLEGNTFPNKVIAFGAKPSVGGQSQRSLFDTFPSLDCIIHFHCPLKTEHRVEFNTTPQFSFECGSYECIESNITGFKEYRVSDTHSIWAGHMDHHGPNIVFSKDINPQAVIDFINKYWDLSRKTDGLSEDNK